jgi:hypothetical protein
MWWLGAGAMIALLFVVSNRGAAPVRERAPSHPEKTADEPGVSALTSAPGRPPPPPDLHAADWKERWDDVRLDPSGRSLGALTAVFMATLATVVKPGVAECAQALPAGSGAIDVPVELYVEAEPSGFKVAHAEVGPSAQLEPATRGCLQRPFEVHLALEHPGVAVGTLYRLSFPLRVQH